MMSDRLKTNKDFWKNLDRLVEKYGFVIDRPKGSRHPRFKEFIYPFDYGYLPFTTSSDGAGLDIWIGSAGNKKVTGILNITDMDKFDAEMKLLYACTPEEMDEIYRINNMIMMKGIMVVRND
jgi:inorganic pyrophosphatase